MDNPLIDKIFFSDFFLVAGVAVRAKCQTSRKRRELCSGACSSSASPTFASPPTLVAPHTSLQASVLCVFDQPCWFPSRRASCGVVGAFAFRCDDCVPNFHRSGQQPTPQDEIHPRTSICLLTAEGKHAAKPKNTINDRCTGASTRRALHSNPILHTPHAPPTFGYNARFTLNYNPHCVHCRAAGCSVP